MDTATMTDGLRAGLVLVFALAQAFMAFWPDLRRWRQTTATRSAALRTPIVPVGPTFAIWGLIFVACLAHAVWQALPGNLADPVLRQIGWFAIGLFAANTLWEWHVPRKGLGWRSVLLIGMELVFLLPILITLAMAEPALRGWQGALVTWPFLLFAGWATAALVVNLSSTLLVKGWSVGPGLSLILLGLAALLALGGVWLTGSVIYAGAVAWALGGIVLGNRRGSRAVAVAAAVLAMALAAFAVTRPDPFPAAPTAAPVPLALLTVRTDALDIGYLAFGPETGPVIIAFHGYPDSVTSWVPLSEALAKMGYRVYLPVLRGFSGTTFRDAQTPRSGQLAALVSDGLAFADALGVRRATLVGADWGARIAQGIAAVAPERVEKIVTFSGYQIAFGFDGAPPPPVGFLPRLWYQAALNLTAGRAVVQQGHADFAWRLWRDWSPSWEETARKTAFAASRPAWEAPDFAAVVLSAYSLTGAGHDPTLAELEAFLAAAPPVTVPVLIAEGADDGLADPYSRVVDALRLPADTAYHTIPGAGHFPHAEAPEHVAGFFLPAP